MSQMMNNEIDQIKTYFINELKNENFTIDKTGAKTIELIGASFYADEGAIFGKPNYEYIDRELDWYESQSTNINDIYGSDREPPEAWQYSANAHGEINSNYGLLVFGEKYYEQFEHVVQELKTNPDSRRASMIYNRPSIWKEYNENGKNDFICTNAVTYYIRDNKLHATVQMRSNDVIFGYRNDWAWQRFMMEEVMHELELDELGDMIWQVQNLHVYERHFHLVV
jgi:thymidylate synthase